MDNDRTLFAAERKKKIVESINDKRRMTVPELCRMFGVSSATMRNDLRELDDAGLITRTHGGAIYKSRTGYEPVMEYRSDKNTDAKAKIAAVALELIDDGDTIIIDTGTTAMELAKVLDRKRNLTVVTNDIKVAALLELIPSFEILMIGGILRKGFHCTVDYGSFSNLGSLSVDKAFLGTNSFSGQKGASTPDLSQSETKRQMIDIAAQVIILCDHTKLETDSFMNFADPEKVDILVTNLISAKLKKRYEDLDIEVRNAAID